MSDDGMAELVMRFVNLDFVEPVVEKVEQIAKVPGHEIRISYFGPLTVEVAMERITDALCVGEGGSEVEGCQCAWVMSAEPIPEKPGDPGMAEGQR